METNAVEREKVGLMLASGYTKKEIATKFDKSVNTVNKQASRLYEKTGSRNLADITRYMIARYSKVPVEDILINAMHDITVLAAVALLVFAAFQPEVIEMVKTSLHSILK